jgi:hypothetical protein
VGSLSTGRQQHATVSQTEVVEQPGLRPPVDGALTHFLTPLGGAFFSPSLREDRAAPIGAAKSAPPVVLAAHRNRSGGGCNDSRGCVRGGARCRLQEASFGQALGPSRYRSALLTSIGSVDLPTWERMTATYPPVSLRGDQRVAGLDG